MHNFETEEPLHGNVVCTPTGNPTCQPARNHNGLFVRRPRIPRDA
jgi:hypothetical protein